MPPLSPTVYTLLCLQQKAVARHLGSAGNPSLAPTESPHFPDSALVCLLWVVDSRIQATHQPNIKLCISVPNRTHLQQKWAGPHAQKPCGPECPQAQAPSQTSMHKDPGLCLSSLRGCQAGSPVPTLRKDGIHSQKQGSHSRPQSYPPSTSRSREQLTLPHLMTTGVALKRWEMAQQRSKGAVWQWAARDKPLVARPSSSAAAGREG